MGDFQASVIWDSGYVAIKDYCLRQKCFLNYQSIFLSSCWESILSNKRFYSKHQFFALEFCPQHLFSLWLVIASQVLWRDLSLHQVQTWGPCPTDLSPKHFGSWLGWCKDRDMILFHFLQHALKRQVMLPKSTLYLSQSLFWAQFSGLPLESVSFLMSL